MEFYELDATALGGGVLMFHGMEGMQEFWWQDLEYSLWPIKAEGFSRTSDQQPRPRLQVANLTGAISYLCMLYDDLCGAKLTLHRTFAQYIDHRNFDGPECIANGGFDTDIAGWVVTLGTVEWSDGKLAVGDPALTSATGYVFDVEDGEEYRFEFDVEDAQIGSAIGSDHIGGGDVLAFAASTLGHNTRTFTAVGNKGYLYFARNAVVTPALIDNLTIRKVGVNPTVDPTQELPAEVWFIERKAGENREQVDFELVSPLDFQGVKLPRRLIQSDLCTFEYRGPYCNYDGPAVAEIDDTPTSDMELDNCSQKLTGCQLREWPDDILNFGGFSAAGLIRT